MYLELYKTGRLFKIRDNLLVHLENCNFCPRKCGVDRSKGEVGRCKTGRYAKVNSFFLHFGEEPEIVGRGGSGTIFFSYCNLKCIYCQNYTLSWEGEGKEVAPEDLAQMMLFLQHRGAENINFVTPTHVVAQILEGLCIAVEGGLRIPLVYNCGGYENVQILKILEGVFDIYMPDFKYADNKVAQQLSGVDDYWEVATQAIKFMHTQVGDLIVEGGVAKRGLLIRHLVLPNRLAGSFAVLKFIKEQISPRTYVNIMGQYYPCFYAYKDEILQRRITIQEHREVVKYAKSLGLNVHY